MPTSWNTKWGARRVRYDPPTLAEALAAAKGFTDDLDGQAEIAAGLMGVPVADARSELSRLSSERRASATVVAAPRDGARARTIVIERKISRRFNLPTSRPAGGAPKR